MEALSRLAVSNREPDPNEFDLTVASLLVGLDAEKYVDVFKKNNIGQATLTELSDEDLEQLGVDDAKVREKIITEVKSLPIFEEHVDDMNAITTDHLEPSEISRILTDTSQHLYHIQLSFLANRMALKKAKNIKDCLLYKDSYASDIALKTLDSITRVLNSMEKVFETKMELVPKKQNRKRKKMIVGAAGCSVVAILAVLFIKSLKNLL